MSQNKQLTGEQKLIRYYFVPMCFVIVATFISLFVAGIGTAIAVSSLGSLAVTIGTLIYIIVFDSRSLWPNDNWHQRAIKAITFNR